MTLLRLNLKKVLIIVGCAGAVAILGAFLWLWMPLRAVRKLDMRYRTVERGMTTNQVYAIMGSVGRWHTNTIWPGWDDTPLPETEARRIRTAMRYSISTFFLPVSFEFAFDDSGKVVGKHRYD